MAPVYSQFGDVSCDVTSSVTITISPPPPHGLNLTRTFIILLLSSFFEKKKRITREL